jgi:hypothetical protein
MAEDILEENEIEKIIMQLAVGQGKFSEKEAELAVNWASEIRILGALLDMVLEGRLVLVIGDGQTIAVKMVQ